MLFSLKEPLLEIKDFGPPTTYGEDKELTLMKKSTPSPWGKVMMRGKSEQVSLTKREWKGEGQVQLYSLSKGEG